MRRCSPGKNQDYHYSACKKIQCEESKTFGVSTGRSYFCNPLKKRTVDLVAQLVEHNTFNVGALGSSPSGITAKLPEM
jgi:hypothetical protein